jgi:hypothetical protein
MRWMLPLATLGTKSPNRSAPRSWRPLVSWVNGSGMTTERVVRFNERFFEVLEQLLPEDRGGDGRPSVNDFLVFDLPRVHDKLAHDWFGETLATDDPDVRVYVGVGVLVGAFAVFVTLRPDGVVDAFWLSMSADGWSVRDP